LAVNVRRVMGHPGTRQLMGLAGIAGAIAVGLTIWFWSQGTAMAPLFTGLTPEDEMAVVQQLQTRQIPFEQQNGAVLIPTDQVHNMRLAMAAEGLPQGAGVGFELIRDAGSLGSSPFMENARYQHVLETELSRTVSSLHPVRAARIHLALPRRSAFVRPNETASAAVMVTLHPGRTLDAGQIAAIVHLVSSSVPQLADDRVSVVDQRGSLLNRPQDGVAGVGLDGEQLAFQARVEQRYMERILQLLQPFTGAERVSAQVMVDMDFSRAEQTREVFDPQSRTIRSEQTSEEMRGDTGGVGGIPGALSNRPPQTAVNAQDTDGRAGGDGSASLQTTRNYEINRTLEHTWQQPGRVQRVNAAVVVDHLPTGADGASAPLSAEQLERIEALVREAIGFDAARGDSINVQNLPFQALDTPEVDSLPLWQEPLIQDLIRQGLGLIVLLLVAFRLFRPAVSAVLGSAIGPDLGPERALAAAGGGAALVPSPGADTDDHAAYTSGTDTAPRNKTDKLDFTPQNDFDDKLAAVREVVGQDPARVANVVRGWINND
ncbi:MAG: flagellar basal-body MS-ring/collar protein FliF, partial [Oceanococcaceae bacterium]